jgi:hypothetical protein
LFYKFSFLLINLKRKLSEHKIQLFFQRVDTIVSRYLKVYIIKPSVLVESEDSGFKNIGLYNVKDSVLNDLTFKERINLFNKIKIETIKVNNCMYFSYNEKNGYQPIIFTIWSLGEEIRIGCFIDQGLGKDILEKQKTKVNRLFKMFQGPLFEINYNEIERNDYYLSEVIISNVNGISLYDSVEKQNYIAQIFAQMISQNILEYLENTSVSSKDKNDKLKIKKGKS